MMTRRKPQSIVRTNQSYKVDTKWEALALAARGAGRVGGLVWRWRTELALLMLTVALFYGVRYEIGENWAGAVVLVASALVLGWPWPRRLLVGRLRCAQSRRRVLAALAELGLANSKGRLPLIVRSRRTSVGERLTLWARVGHCAELMQDKIDILRAACNVRDIRVTRDARKAGVITVDVVRHDPLGAAEVIRSPIHDLLTQVANRWPADPAYRPPSTEDGN